MLSDASGDDDVEGDVVGDGEAVGEEDGQLHVSGVTSDGMSPSSLHPTLELE